MGLFFSKERAPVEIRSQHFPEFRESLQRMDGKTVAITGCTSGTGYICAKVCAELGARVVMLNRASERADAALKSLQEVADAQVLLIPCDLMDFSSVRAAGSLLRSTLTDGLDVLCNNAGIMAMRDEATVDGCDVQMQTNHLSHFLLTAEVWPLLEHAAKGRGEARIVNHTSVARELGPKGGKHLEEQYLDKNGGNLGGDINGWMPFTGARWVRYQQSKLANVVFTYALRDRLEANDSRIKSLCAHPGVCHTNLFVKTHQDEGIGTWFMNSLMSNHAQSAEDGAVPLLTCCCSSDAKSGDFYGPSKWSGPCTLMPPEPEEKLADGKARQLLWDISCKVTGARFPF